MKEMKRWLVAALVACAGILGANAGVNFVYSEKAFELLPPEEDFIWDEGESELLPPADDFVWDEATFWLMPDAEDKTQTALEQIFDAENTGTTVEPVYNASDVIVGHTVILGANYGPLALSNDFGAVTIDLNGWTIRGTNGVDGTTTTAGGNGGAAITVAGASGASAGDTMISATNTAVSGSTAAIVGGNGGDGNPAGKGGLPIVDATGAEVAVTDPTGLVKKGDDGVTLLPDVVATTEFTYDGTEKRPVAATNVYEFAGDICATNAGTYTLKITPAAGHAWGDGSTATTNIAWKILPRAATLTSADDTFTYDAAAHSNMTVTAAGFVTGEGVSTNGFATITDVGTAPNAFGYEFLANTKAENYRVTCVTGLLTVVKGAAQKEIEEAFGGGAVVEPMADDDGNVTNWLVTVTNDLTGPVILPESVTDVVINLNGHGIVGLDGVTTEDGAGTDGAPAIVVMNAAAQVAIVGPGSVTGGDGGDGYPPGNGVPAATDADGNEVTPAVIGDATVLRGADGTTWDPSAFGTVKYPKADASTGLVKAGSSATWTAKAGEGCVFTGWEWTNGAPAAAFAALSENERRDTSLKLKIAAGEQVRPTDAEATWAWIDKDRIESVELTPSNLAVVCRSYVKASVSGLPSGLKFDKKTLAITGRAKKSETKTVKVTVRNGSGYTWKESFDVTVEGGEVTKVASARGSRVQTGEPAMLWGEPSLGKVKGSKVVVSGKKVSIKATPAKNCIFLGWYEDPVFANAATNLPKGYLAASQSVVVPEGGLKKLFARFVALEGWTVGTFDGVYYEDVGGTNVARGTVTLTVSNKGKVSGKTLVGGKSYAFKANALDDAVETEEAGLVFVAHPTVKVDGVERVLTLRVFKNQETGLGAAEILYGEEEDAPFATAVQNGWKLKPSKLPDFQTKPAVALTVGGEGVDLALTFGAKGVVKAAGTVGGVKVSAKAQVLPVAWRSTQTGNLLAQVPVFVPKAGFCVVYDVLLAVGADGKFSEAVLSGAR